MWYIFFKHNDWFIIETVVIYVTEILEFLSGKNLCIYYLTHCKDFSLIHKLGICYYLNH